jgi:hypothetical protein
MKSRKDHEAGSYSCFIRIFVHFVTFCRTMTARCGAQPHLAWARFPFVSFV